MQTQQPEGLRPFTSNPCAEGYEVICTQTGHAMTQPRSARSSNGIAQKLNRLHAAGDMKALYRALGSYE